VHFVGQKMEWKWLVMQQAQRPSDIQHDVVRSKFCPNYVTTVTAEEQVAAWSTVDSRFIVCVITYKNEDLKTVCVNFNKGLCIDINILKCNEHVGKFFTAFCRNTSSSSIWSVQSECRPPVGVLSIQNPSVNTQLHVKSWFRCIELCCHILLYCDIFGSHCQLGIISGAVSDLVTVVVCELVVADYVVLTKLFVVQHRASVYWALKVRILTPGFEVFKCVMSMTMFVFPFFQMFSQFCWYPCVFLSVVQGFKIVLLWTVRVEGIKTWLIHCLCHIFSLSYNGNRMSVIPTSCPDIRVYLVLLST
jgi:hypothetical protein